MLGLRTRSLALLVLLTTSAHAQDLTGSWQGRLRIVPDRLILDVSKSESGIRAVVRYIDQWDWDQSVAADSVSVAGSNLTLVQDSVERERATSQSDLLMSGAPLARAVTYMPTGPDPIFKSHGTEVVSALRTFIRSLTVP